MSAIKLFSSSRNPVRALTGLLLCLWSGVHPLLSQVVPVQANVDAQAQRRLQSESQESLRRRRIEENTRRLVPALNASNLTSPEAPKLIWQALALIADLQGDNMAPKASIQEAAKKSPLGMSATQKTSNYLLDCWRSVSNRITPEDLQRMRNGLEPKTQIQLPPFRP